MKSVIGDKMHYCKTTFYNIHTLPVKSWDRPYRAIFFFLIFTSFYKYPNIYIKMQYTKNTFNMHFALLLLTHISSVHIPSAAVWIFRVRRTLSSSQMDQAYKLPSIFFSLSTLQRSSLTVWPTNLEQSSTVRNQARTAALCTAGSQTLF